MGLDTAFLGRRPLLWIVVGVVFAGLGIVFAASGDGAGYPLIVVGAIFGVISALLALFAPRRKPPA
jgi:hypothetical protein